MPLLASPRQERTPPNREGPSLADLRHHLPKRAAPQTQARRRRTLYVFQWEDLVSHVQGDADYRGRVDDAVAFLEALLNAISDRFLHAVPDRHVERV